MQLNVVRSRKSGCDVSHPIHPQPPGKRRFRPGFRSRVRARFGVSRAAANDWVPPRPHAPSSPLANTGAIWYQGEANFSRAWAYRALLPALIADWRTLFAQGDFSFYIVGLPAFMERKPTPDDDPWTELREAQALTAATVKNTGLATIVDTTHRGRYGHRIRTGRTPSGRGAVCVASQPTCQPVQWRGPARRSFSNRQLAAADGTERPVGDSLDPGRGLFVPPYAPRAARPAHRPTGELTATRTPQPFPFTGMPAYFASSRWIFVTRSTWPLAGKRS